MFVGKHKVIGVLGGMGPRATMDLYEYILQLTEAPTEQDHIATLIYSNPKIPDRSNAVTAEQQRHLAEYLVETGKALERGGADVVILPCNGAHQYLNEVALALKIPVLNMIDEVARHLDHRLDKEREVMLFATQATYRSGIYRVALAKRGIKMAVPSDKQQAQLMTLIYQVKANIDLAQPRQTLKALIEQYDMPIILGCTELPLVVDEKHYGIKLTNPGRILAQAAVDFVLQGD